MYTIGPQLIRYWSDNDQKHPRLISFPSMQSAMDMLNYYRDCGFKCELVTA